MSSAQLPLDRAVRALEFVEHDATALDRFVAAFDGPGDAVAILRATAIPDAVAEAARTRTVERLRRVAFGRTATLLEQSAAADAQRELETLERTADVAAARLTRAVDAVLAPVPSTTPLPELVEGGDPDPLPGQNPLPGRNPLPEPVEGRATWRQWLLPAVVALVIGAIGASAGTLALSPRPAPSPTPTVPASSALPPDALVVTGDAHLVSGPGNLNLAKQWFAHTQRSSDKLPDDFDDHNEIDRESSRLALTSSRARFWIAKSTTDGFCLVVRAITTGSGGSTCATTAMFEANGLAISVGDESGSQTALWDGRRTTVVLAP